MWRFFLLLPVGILSLSCTRSLDSDKPANTSISTRKYSNEQKSTGSMESQDDQNEAAIQFQQLYAPDANGKIQLNEQALDSTLTLYQRTIATGEADPMDVFYCGIITEKLHGREKARSYYLQTLQQAKEHLAHAEKRALEPIAGQSLTASQLRSIRPKLVADYKLQQELLLLLSEAMTRNKPESFARLNAFASQHSETVSPLIMMGFKMDSRKSILDWFYTGDD